MDLQLIKQSLSRDYYKNPLCKGEYPPKEDIIYLYYTCNLTVKPISKILNISDGKVSTIIKFYGLRKTQEQINYSRHLQWENYSEDYKQTRIKNIKNSFTKDVRDTISNKRKIYLSNRTEEQKQHQIDAFWDTWNNRTPEEIESRRHKLSVAYRSKTPEEREQSINKFRGTFHKTWSNKTVEEKQLYIDKMQNSKRINGTFNASKKENIIYEKLCKLFVHVDRQYKCERYPFACDFYIPEEDLFIEFQGNWTHGGLPFNPSDPFCIKQLSFWKIKSKNSKFYSAAIHVWTVRDVKKRNLAKTNKLNWVEFFTLSDLDDWIKTRNSGLTMN